MSTLSDRALLVGLNISQWTARKLDRRETSAINARHGLSVEAARVNKNLLPLATNLERVHQTTSFIRKDFAKRTLPWSLEGVQILKADAYMDFTRTVNTWQSDWESAVDEFVASYPAAYDEAKLLLGTMFNPDDYPAVTDIRRRFSFSIRFMPMPDVQDFRVDIGDEALERLRADLTKDIKASMGEAMSSAWKRVYEVVSRAHERLANPQNVFRDSLIDNAVELCALLPSLNVTDDPDLEKMRQAIEGSLCKYNTTTLREDPAVRADVADKMADIMAKMAGFYTPLAA